MVVPKSATAFLLTGVVATVAGLLIERYVPDNRKAPIYSTTTEDPNKKVFEEIDWLKRANSVTELIRVRGNYAGCDVRDTMYPEKKINVYCWGVGGSNGIRFLDVSVN